MTESLDPSDPFAQEPPEKPAPPPAAPPSPPRPELLRPPRPLESAPEAGKVGGPFAGFLERRLEAMERELSIERERAHIAEASLRQQEAVRSEVETHLKSLTEQLRREKSERDNAEEKSQARGRVEALEKRLDEMHQTWISLLKETISERQTGVEGTLKEELRNLGETLGRKIEEAKSVGPKIDEASKALEAHGAKIVEVLQQRFSQLALDVKEQTGSFERQAALRQEKAEGNLQSLTRERAALRLAFEEERHSIRQEFLKEGVKQQVGLDQKLAELSGRLAESKAAQENAGQKFEETGKTLGRVVDILMTPPPAKDKIILDLEKEKLALTETLNDRALTLSRLTEDRKNLERTLTQNLVEANHGLEQERKKNILLSAKAAELERELPSLRDKALALERLIQDEEGMRSRIVSERDALAKALAAEAAKVRELIDKKSADDAVWAEKLAELQKKLSAEMEERARQNIGVSDLRAQMATLSEHLAKALQEKELALQKTSVWPEEREKLMQALREKEELVSFLNNAFQNLLGKQP